MPPSPLLPVSNNYPDLRNLNTEIPFDLSLSDNIFPRGSSEPDNALLTAALLKRNSELTPSSEEVQGLQSLVSRIESIVETIILSPSTFPSCEVDEIRQVGSVKQGTSLAGDRTAELVVIFKSVPTKEAVEALHVKLAQELQETGCVRSAITDYGFELSNLQGTAKILVTIIPKYLHSLKSDLHFNPSGLRANWQSIKHSRWVEENANTSTIKVLIRILRDIRYRFDQFKPLPQEKLDLLAHFAVTNTGMGGEPFPLIQAFQRAFSLMSTGLFLPTYSDTTMRGVNLSASDSDQMTAAAQTLVLILAQGLPGYNAVLGLSHQKDEILSKATVWEGGVTIQPSIPISHSNGTATAMDEAED